MTLLLAVSLALAACSHDTPPAQAAPAYTAAGAAPVVVNAAPASSAMTDMLTGGALGYLLGKSSNGSSAHAAAPASSTVVHKTVINQTVVRTAPAVRPPTPAAAQPAASMSVTAKPAGVPVLAKTTPNYAARSAYANPTGNSAYRAAAAPARAPSYSAPFYSRNYAPPSSVSSARR